MTLKPLSDNVLLKGVEEEKTAGGLILATANKEKPERPDTPPTVTRELRLSQLYYRTQK